MDDIKITVLEPHPIPNNDLTKEDVWGKFDERTHEPLNEGMVIANWNFGKDEADSYSSVDPCPIFGDYIPWKSVTVVCDTELEDQVTYWLEYVHGTDCVSNRKELDDGKVALRSDYQCW